METNVNAKTLALVSILSSTLLSACGGGGTSGNSNNSGNSGSTPPAVTITAGNRTLLQGETTDISWTSSNSSSCQGTGAWSAILGTQGTQAISSNEIGEKNYQITCTGNGGSDSKNLKITVVASRTITGQIYERSEDLTYSTNAKGIGITGAIVNIAGKQVQTTVDGYYSVKVPDKILATDTIIISKTGYIPTEISRSILDVSTTAINIGLYPEKIVTKRSEFISGIFTMDNGGHLNNIYDKGYFPPTYDRIKNKLSANLVAISDPVWVDSFDVGTNTVNMNRNSSIPMLTRSQYANLTKLAHDRGLKFMMSMGVFPSMEWANSRPWEQQLPMTVPSTNKNFWDAWFSAYKTKVLENTQYAIDFNIDYISLCMNCGFMTSQSVSYWKDMISSMRAKGYQGKILYQAMISPSIDFYESDQFNLADASKYSNDTDRINAFISSFDYIALDVNELSSKINGSDYISRINLKSSLTKAFSKYKNYPIPFIVQMATPSVNDGLTTRDTIEPAAWFPTTKLRQVDLLTQADAYSAVMEVINEQKSGNGNIVGILSWGYYFVDNYRVEVNAFTKEFNQDGTLVSYTGTNDEGAYDKSASIRGKPSESLMKWWFDRIK